MCPLIFIRYGSLCQSAWGGNEIYQAIFPSTVFRAFLRHQLFLKHSASLGTKSDITNRLHVPGSTSVMFAFHSTSNIWKHVVLMLFEFCDGGQISKGWTETMLKTITNLYWLQINPSGLQLGFKFCGYSCDLCLF